jgi:preprotein translocase subunit YajC
MKELLQLLTINDVFHWIGFLFLFFMLLYAIWYSILLIKTNIKEKKEKKKFQSIIEVGDKTYYYSKSLDITGEVHGEVIKVGKDEVSIVIKIPKNLLYPDKE